MRLSFFNCFTNANPIGNLTYNHHFHDLGLALTLLLLGFKETLRQACQTMGFCFNWILNESVCKSFQNYIHILDCKVWIMETWFKCNCYFFAFNLKLLIKLNINYGFEYKKGYLSFGLKGLSCGFSNTYFDKISGEMFCE